MSAKEIALLPLPVGQKVFTVFTISHFPPQVFHTEIVAVEKFGKRKVYILKCFNERILKKWKLWNLVSDFDREESYSTERENIYATLTEAVNAQLIIYDAKIARINEEKASFFAQALALTTKKPKKS